MGTEITTTGSKKIKTLKKQFNEKFPYLVLNLYASSMKKKYEKGEFITSLSSDKRLSEVREKVGDGSISIHGRKKVKNLEAEFDEVFGLYAQVCYRPKGWKPGDNYKYTFGGSDDKSLSALNREMKEKGAIKDIA